MIYFDHRVISILYLIFSLTILAIRLDNNMLSRAINRVRVVTFDVTGTLLVHKYPIVETYADAAQWALLPNPPSAKELKPAFKQAYKECLLKYPCFQKDATIHGHASTRDWWYTTVKRAVELTGRQYATEEFDRFFRRVYQHYGSLEGYELLDDTLPLLNFLKDRNITMGIISNTPTRTVETVLPMLGIHNYFKFFICCQDIGYEKPNPQIFEKAYLEATFWENIKQRDKITSSTTMDNFHPLQKNECLHLGDSFPADYCGSRAAGFQSLFLDRSGQSKVNVYQDWLTAPSYNGKSEDDIKMNTITNLKDVMKRFNDS